MKTKLFAALGEGIVGIVALSFLVTTPVSAQTKLMNAIHAAAVTSASPQLPRGTKIIAHVPLDGQSVTRMYTQSEYGHTYLYIQHGQYSFTTVDISKKQYPQKVDHAPGNIEPSLYEELFEGGSIEASASWAVTAGVDSTEGAGMRSALENSDPNDAKLLRAFGSEYANLADRDRRLVYFASPSQLLIVQDNRMTEIDFIAN